MAVTPCPWSEEPPASTPAPSAVSTTTTRGSGVLGGWVPAPMAADVRARRSALPCVCASERSLVAVVPGWSDSQWSTADSLSTGRIQQNRSSSEPVAGNRGTPETAPSVSSWTRSQVDRARCGVSAPMWASHGSAGTGDAVHPTKAPARRTGRRGPMAPHPPESAHATPGFRAPCAPHPAPAERR